MGHTQAPAAISASRRCAYAVLRRVFERGAYADHAFHAEAADLQERERPLAMRLAYGAVQRKGTVDHVIARLTERPLERLDPRVLAALRLGLYELLYLQGAPDYAVVAQAVELSKDHARPGHGLVNAVLRRAAREGADALIGGLRDDTPEQAAVKHSHPEWLARLWWRQLGAAQARALMASNNEPSEVALRANTLVGDAATLAGQLPVATHGDARIPEAVVLDEPFDLHSSQLWRAGAFLAQARAAMLVSRVLGPRPGERVLDLCAAPGGKSTHIAALMAGAGEVLAVERHPGRASALERTAARLRAHNLRVEIGDAASWPDSGQEAPQFDRVLVDPPCSGLGTLQARADLRWRMTPEAVKQMAREQVRILSSGAAALRPGGVLVYSTCTISTTENERVIDAFLDSHRDFSVEDLAAELPELSLAHASGEQPPLSAGLLQTLPHRDHTAGFFIARLRRV
ncbi:MAG: rRNA (cytosine967-C5)-methyltransferase [Solirubrobacteraceae bacterium]|jgi:16S rRNA (cytosine967-C5)-methyltransferase|nr:rRNA (cytosine967-C5)-methyltransferase [Solirubrobacteraceae bacterium]